MSKSLPKPIAKPAATQKPDTYLPWPTTPKDLGPIPRLFRIHRINAFEWQAYVTENGIESPIGKPDLFDILKAKICAVIRVEGQAEFLAAKNKAELAHVQ